jgi:hypothetical protein
MFRAEKSAPEISVLKYSFGPGSASGSEGGETLLAGRNNRKKARSALKTSFPQPHRG